MPELIHNDTGLPIAANSEEVPAAVDSGEYQLSGRMYARLPTETDPGAINVLNPQGERVELEPKYIQDALSKGYTIPNEVETWEARKKEVLDTPAMAAATAVLGAAETATFGLSTKIATKTIGGAENYNDLMEANPTARIVGQVAGAVLPGGAGYAIGKGSLGIAAKAVPAAAGKQALGSLLARGAARGAIAGGLEGGAMGLAQLVTEEELGNAEYNAENIASYLGGGALLGGVTGGVLGGVGAAITAPIKKAAEAVTDNAGPFAKAYAKTASVFGNADEDDVLKLLTNKETRQAATAGPEAREELARRMSEIIDELEDVSRPIEESAIGGLKKGRVREVIRRGNEAEVGLAAQESIGAARARVQAILDEPGIHGSWGVGKAKQIKKLLDETEDRILKKAAGDNAEAFINLDTLKRKLGKFAKPGRNPTAQDQESVAAFRGMYDDLKMHLERADLYGDAGKMQGEVNKAWHNYLNSSSGFRKGFTSKVGQSGWDPIYRADPGKVRSFVDKMTGASGDLSYKAIQDNTAARQDLVKRIGDFYELGDLAPGAAKSQDALSRLTSTLDEAKNTVGWQNKLRDMGGDDFSTALAGGLSFGPAGAAVAGAITRPDRIIRTIAGAERVAEKLSKLSGIKHAIDTAERRIAKSIQTALTVTPKAPLVTSTAGVSLFVEALGGKPPKGSDKQDAVRYRVAQVDDLMSDPQGMADRIAANLQGLETHAPAHAAAIATQTAKVMKFLQDKAPRNHSPDPLQPTIDTGWKPTKSDAEKFARYWQAAMDPGSVIDDIGRGTISPESVETLKELYPRMFETTRQALMASAANIRERVPYAKRIHLGLMFDVPLDPTMRPDFIARTQASYQQQPQQGQAGGGNRLTGLSKVKSAERMKTPAQQMMGGEG